MDTAAGKQGSKSALLVLTERVSRFEIIIKLRNKTQKSITVDNGVEFLDMESLEKSVYNKLSKRTIIYYAHPYCSPRKWK